MTDFKNEQERDERLAQATERAKTYAESIERFNRWARAMIHGPEQAQVAIAEMKEMNARFMIKGTAYNAETLNGHFTPLHIAGHLKDMVKTREVRRKKAERDAQLIRQGIDPIAEQERQDRKAMPDGEGPFVLEGKTRILKGLTHKHVQKAALPFDLWLLSPNVIQHNHKHPVAFRLLKLPHDTVALEVQRSPMWDVNDKLDLAEGELNGIMGWMT